MTDGDLTDRELTAIRPAPRAAFRGHLRRRLLALGPPPARPPRLRLLSAAYAAAGLVLLGLGLLSVLGVGPLGT